MWRYSELTPRQREIVDLMRNGWELGGDMSINGRDWIQKGGLGRGGEAKNVNGNTTYALYKKGVIIQIKETFLTVHYVLNTKDGETAKR